MTAESLGFALGYGGAFSLIGWLVWTRLLGRGGGSGRSSNTDDLDACPECSMELAPMLDECPRCDWQPDD